MGKSESHRFLNSRTITSPTPSNTAGSQTRSKTATLGTRSSQQPPGLFRVDSMCDRFSDLSVNRGTVKRPVLKKTKSALVSSSKNTKLPIKPSTIPGRGSPTIAQHYTQRKNTAPHASHGVSGSKKPVGTSSPSIGRVNTSSSTVKKNKTPSSKRSLPNLLPNKNIVGSPMEDIPENNILSPPRAESEPPSFMDLPDYHFKTPPQQQQYRHLFHENESRLITMNDRYDLSPDSFRILQMMQNGGIGNKMQVDVNEWVSDTNKALSLRLVYPKDLASPEPFAPLLTWPLYGEEELFYGYKNLKISLSYASGSLYSYLACSYSEKQQGVPNVLLPIAEKLTEGYTGNYDDFLHRVETDAETFRPMGEKFHEYTRRIDDSEEVTYELYLCSFDTPGFKQYHRRMQLFLLWYIDGVNFLKEDEPWEFVVAYEKRMRGSNPMYTFIGYTSFYSFFYFPDKKRVQISQFIILPPFQRKGHAGEMYNNLYNLLLARQEVAEIGVEQPNDDFMDMRDKNDMERLFKDGVFEGVTAPVGPEFVEKIHKKYKLYLGQAERCVEIGLLRNCKRNVKSAYKAYRIFVKARIYRKQMNGIQEFSAQEKKDKLAEVYQALEEDYMEVLNRLTC
ncbi:histone acetyltransferase 1 [Nowakowskiella sp. JEL0407]|nr:histone acetyltransferase 1 [Nowakowskiella sp. JEL0407]